MPCTPAVRVPAERGVPPGVLRQAGCPLSLLPPLQQASRHEPQELGAWWGTWTLDLAEGRVVGRSSAVGKARAVLTRG